MATSVFCIASTYDHASTIVRLLRDNGFLSENISILLPDKSGPRDLGHERNTKAPEGAVTGAGAGGVLGGTLGLLAGIGALAIPGVGPLIAAGPILATLSGAALGAATGGLVGGLAGLGIPEFEAKRYAGKIMGGNVLISVHCADSEEVKAARRIFQEAGAEDIETASEAKADIKVTTGARQRA